ncbi:hypothetical protein FHL15_004188 [Xylaria flabelliformis]|uniref:Uncharacterized protein n=1 Tax=Xylaria flabelliformis TaxID=2512241 RepID=A0A553I4K5_9PEZI|nr:hypothetical protein FHL15_004188 [Xylaria flabelliformis]
MFGKNKKATNDVKHQKPFAYRMEDNVRPSLQPGAYRARELLNCTVASFYEIRNNQLTPHQRQAKRDFIELFERQTKTPLKDLDDSILGLYGTLAVLMGHLDEFFFFGSLTKSSSPLIHRLVLTNLPPHADCLGGCHEVDDKEGSPQFVISLYRDHQEHQDLPSLASTLAHEMTHAFLAAFVCSCSECQRNEINTTGVKSSHHGPIFRGLEYAIMASMADWSAGLDNYFKRCVSGTYIHSASPDCKMQGVEDAKESGDLKKMGMRPYIKKPSPRLLIRISENRISIDVKRLRANVRRTAALVKPDSTGRQMKGENSSLESENLGIKPAIKLPDGWPYGDCRGKKRPAPSSSSSSSSNEDSEKDWATEESESESESKSTCIYCTARACRHPFMKDGH